MLKTIFLNKKLMMVLAIAWTILIFIGCSLPGKDLPPISVFDHFDKVIHFIFLFVFSIFWMLAMGIKSLKGYLLIISVCFGYGFFIEWYQINFVPGRSWDVWDGIADGIGGIFGVFFFKKFLMKFV